MPEFLVALLETQERGERREVVFQFFLHRFLRYFPFSFAYGPDDALGPFDSLLCITILIVDSVGVSITKYVHGLATETRIEYVIGVEPLQ